MTGVPSTTELIDDREIQEWEADRFRHQDFASQLADLAATAKTPANVALYGPWGSGKTGVANLLHVRLRQKDFVERHGEIAFARFDAFKYAEIPLRRHFLSQMAVNLLREKEADEFRRRLYQSETRTDIDFRALDVWRALLVFLALLGAGLVIAVLIAAIVAGVVTTLADPADPGFWVRARTYFSGVIGFSFAPAAVLAGLFAIAGKSLPVTRSRDIPSTDEEFERQFRDLLKESGAGRLVVFIDELDRCPPNRVVDVLDTVRTFLDVENTIFIIAADQHVLEQALTRRVQQTTPPDPTNPYYSSGSAYLDKVFHYQMSLPALLPGRITQYAVGLVEGRPGVWSNPAVNVPWVISVLIPTHVRSPRRVKTLLNNYVLAFRLAQQRFEEGHLSSDPSGRALELAKLVTLRTEFPSFARELTLSSRLPELFLAIAANGSAGRPPEVPAEVWEKAGAFVAGHLAVDEMLNEQDSPLEVDLDDADEVEDEDDVAAASRETGAALRQQLHHYLLKTRHITNPGRDLIFLEGQGHLFGLEESLAEQIEDAAIGGRTDEVVATVNEQESTVQVNLVRLLAQRAREAFPGVEGQNLVGALLSVAAERSDDVLRECADEAIDAVNAHLDIGNLAAEHLPGAFVVGLRSQRREANELVSYVLTQADAVTDNSLGRLILANTGDLPDHQLGRVADVAVALLINGDTARDAVILINGLPNAAELLNETQDRIATAYQSVVDDDKVTADQDISREVGDDVEDLLLAFQEAVDQAIELNAVAVTNTLLAAGFEAEDPAFWASAGNALSQVSPSDLTERVQQDVLTRAEEMAPIEAAEWLRVLPDDFAETSDRRALVDALVRVLWSHRSELGEDSSKYNAQFLDAMSEVQRIQAPDAATGRVDIVASVDRDLGPAATSVAQANQLAVIWGYARRFVEMHLLPPDATADAIAQRLIATSNGQIGAPDSTDNQLRTFLTGWSIWVGQNSSREKAVDLTNAVKGCAWLPTPAKESLALRVAAEAVKLHSAVDPPYDASEVADLAESHGAAIGRGLSSWIETFAEEPASSFRVFEPLIRSGKYGTIAESVKKYAERLDRDALTDLARFEIASSAGNRLSTDFLRDVRFHEADDIGGAELIVNAYDQTGTNNDRRRDLLDAWGVLQPTSPSARHRLIDNVALPMLKDGGRQALDHIKSRMHVIANPEGRKNALRDALRKAAGGKDKDRRLESLMLEHGIRIQKRKGLLGWTTEEVDEP